MNHIVVVIGGRVDLQWWLFLCHGRGGGGNRENGGVIIGLNLVWRVGIEKGKKRSSEDEGVKRSWDFRLPTTLLAPLGH